MGITRDAGDRLHDRARGRPERADEEDDRLEVVGGAGVSFLEVAVERAVDMEAGNRGGRRRGPRTDDQHRRRNRVPSSMPSPTFSRALNLISPGCGPVRLPLTPAPEAVRRS